MLTVQSPEILKHGPSSPVGLFIRSEVSAAVTSVWSRASWADASVAPNLSGLFVLEEQDKQTFWELGVGQEASTGCSAGRPLDLQTPS